MLEIIKEAGTILKDLPDLAIWILVGILFYKVFIIGGVLSLTKFSINKLHDFMVKPKTVEKIVKYDFDGIVYKHTGSLDQLKGFLTSVSNEFNEGHSLGEDEIDFIKKAVVEKIKRHNLGGTYALKRRNWEGKENE